MDNVSTGATEYHPPRTSTKVSWATSPGVHLCHLLVEEVDQVLFVDICSDTANVQPTRLAREVRVASDTHTK